MGPTQASATSPVRRPPAIGGEGVGVGEESNDKDGRSKPRTWPLPGFLALSMTEIVCLPTWVVGAQSDLHNLGK